jgi:hypothetical protein
VQSNAGLNAHGVGPASQDSPAVAIPPNSITHNVYYVKRQAMSDLFMSRLCC